MSWRFGFQKKSGPGIAAVAAIAAGFAFTGASAPALARMGRGGLETRAYVVGQVQKTHPERPESLAQQPAKQTTTGTASPANPGPNAFDASGDDSRIGPHDVIDVHVEDAPELSRKFTISGDGTFTMPYLKKIDAKDKTTDEVEKIIADGLRGRYLKDPHVSVSMVQWNSRTYFLQGAVHSPGPYTIQGQATVLKLLTLGGGLAENHGSTAFIIREIEPDREPASAAASKPAGEAPGGSASGSKGPGATGIQEIAAKVPAAEHELIKVNLSGLFKGDFSQDVLIQPGDVVNVPVTDMFFVTGEVHSGGAFALRDGVTLGQAISMAQGLTPKASSSAVIFRFNPVTGKREEMKVDVGNILRGKKEDLPILANDTIIVPNSRSKSALTMLFNAFGATATRMAVP